MIVELMCGRGHLSVTVPDVCKPTIIRKLASPPLAVSPPGDPRLFAVEQPGRVWRIDGGRRQRYVVLRPRLRRRFPTTCSCDR